jgi:hypothetical protein
MLLVPSGSGEKSSLVLSKDVTFHGLETEGLSISQKCYRQTIIKRKKMFTLWSRGRMLLEYQPKMLPSSNHREGLIISQRCYLLDQKEKFAVVLSTVVTLCIRERIPLMDQPKMLPPNNHREKA